MNDAPASFAMIEWAGGYVVRLAHAYAVPDTVGSEDK